MCDLLEEWSDRKPYIIGIDTTLINISQRVSKGRVLVVKSMCMWPRFDGC